jgi:predicted dehydrogenase
LDQKTLWGALVGTGSIAPYHLTAWSRAPGVEIVALCNRTVAKAHKLAKRYGIDPAHVYGEVDKLLARAACTCCAGRLREGRGAA